MPVVVVSSPSLATYEPDRRHALEKQHEATTRSMPRARHAAQRTAPARHQADLADMAPTADKEGWPAARFLAAIAEHELAERDRRRIQRHLAEAHCLPGKTLDTFDSMPSDDLKGTGA